jgi:hypothetical protein
MNISDGLMILAVLTAPFLAIFAQRKIDESKEHRGQKLWIFRTLMATRGNKISLEHVQALNMIDLFFERKGKEKAIIEKWDEYLDHLNQPIKDDDKNYQVKLEQWTVKGDDILADMLQLMGKSLGYDFDKVRIRKAIYVPRGHGDVDLENRVIRRGIAEIVIGRKSLPVSVSGIASEQQNALK